MSRCNSRLAEMVFGFIFVIMVFGADYAKGFDIVLDGKAVAVIVVPDSACDSVNRAAWELQYHTEKASGAKIEIYNENSRPLTGGGFIYLGACQATSEAAIVTDGLGRNEFIKKTIGDNLFIVGRDMAGPWYAKDWLEAGTLVGVYDFLSDQMGVRWLWPGKLGEMVPKTSNIAVGDLDEVKKMPLRSSRFHPSYRAQKDGWALEESRKQFAEAEMEWLRRQGFSWDTRYRSKHSFGEYWERFGKTHPEYFNLLPDGTRRPDPYHVCKGDGSYISMCVSEPGLWGQIVDDWKLGRKDNSVFIYAGENDTAGSCCCERCMAWDVSSASDEERLESAKRLFADKSMKWTLALGSVSDRYAKFYKSVLEVAQKTDTNAIVSGFAYGNYSEAPIETKLNDHVVIHFVGKLAYPWTQEKMDLLMKRWKGWADSGAVMVFRPNFMLDGHCMPIYFANKFAEVFSYCYRNSMIGTEFDSNTGQYGTQGPNLYVMARMHRAIDKSVDDILSEYYGAFGLAEASIRDYFELWEKVSSEATDQDCLASMEGALGAETAGWNRFYMAMGNIFTPDVMAEGKKILERAADAAKSEPESLARVEFLQKGLRNAELTLKAQRAYEEYQKDDNVGKFAKVLGELDDYRASVEGDNVANMAYLAWAENFKWSRSSVKFVMSAGESLPDDWKFMWDVGKKGIEQGWYGEGYDVSSWFDIGIDSAWESQPIGKEWEDTHGVQYDGLAWYSNKFIVAKSGTSKPTVKLVFGAVDEACKVWVNGQLVLDRPFPYKGDHESWQKSFEVDISEYVRFDDVNVLRVQVEDNSGAGGIWQPVKMLVSGLDISR